MREELFALPLEVPRQFQKSCLYLPGSRQASSELVGVVIDVFDAFFLEFRKLFHCSFLLFLQFVPGVLERTGSAAVPRVGILHGIALPGSESRRHHPHPEEQPGHEIGNAEIVPGERLPSPLSRSDGLRVPSACEERLSVMGDQKIEQDENDDAKQDAKKAETLADRGSIVQETPRVASAERPSDIDD